MVFPVSVTSLRDARFASDSTFTFNGYILLSEMRCANY